MLAVTQVMQNENEVRGGRGEKFYKDVERLDIGKAFEETRDHLDFIPDFALQLQS